MQIARNRSDSILDFCISAIQERGQTVDQCLTRYPEERVELEPLLGLVVRLQVTQSLHAAPRFQAAAADRLRLLAQSQPRRARAAYAPVLRPQHKGYPHVYKTQPGWRLLLASLLLTVLILSTIGTLAASAQTLPGDFLYPIKRAQENIEMTFTPGSAGQARLHLEFANRRIDEAVTLLEENRPLALDPVLADYNDQMQTELSYLDQKSGLTPSEQSGLANDLLTHVSNNQARLASLTKDAPQSAQGNLQLALTTSQKAYNRAAEIIHTNPIIPASPTVLPSPSPTRPASTNTPVPSPTSLPPSGTPLLTQPTVRSSPFSSVRIHTPTLYPRRTQPAAKVTLAPQTTPTPLPKAAIKTSPPNRFPLPTLRPTPRPWAFPYLKSR